MVGWIPEHVFKNASGQPTVDFPPRSTSELILTGAGILPHTSTLQEDEERPDLDQVVDVRGSIQTHQHILMPRLEIPIFEGVKLHW